jgi:arylsulfatase
MTGATQPEIRGAEGAEPRGYDGFGGVVSPRSSESQPWWPRRRTPQHEAPNVIVMLVDDMGFSDVQPFGSEIATPAIQALADEGYRFSNFRVTPLCAPSRAALLTGANPHRAGFGMVPHVDPGYPGMSMVLPDGMPTMAESFREGGYATFMVGKWHLTREAEMHDAADKMTWPLQKGFDRYFGSMDGFTTLYHPHRIVRDNSPVTEQFDDDEYLTDRLTDEALGMIDAHHTGGERQPFFLYFAHHAVHGPVQAKLDKITTNNGKYAEGWDRVRAERFQRQLDTALLPEGTELSASGIDQTDGVPAWSDLDDEQRELYARHMEVYAAAISSIDESVERVVAHLKEIGEYENTIFVFTSDNGGTGEGGVEGTRSYFSRFTSIPMMPADWVADVPRPLDELGGPRVHGHYPRGWAHASNTPFRLYKGSVLEGGVHSPLIVSWPAALARAEGDVGVRSQFAYITDIAPTLMELAGITRPCTLDGVPTLPVDGQSFAPFIRDSSAARERDGQHITLLGQRAFYRGRFKAVAAGPGRDLSVWQLYDIEADPTEARNIATEHPDIVAELAEEWRKAAWHNTVFPLPDEPSYLAQRPSTELYLAQPVTLYPGTPTLERFRSSKLIQLRSFTVQAHLDGGLGDGVLFSHGDQGGGYVVWIEAGSLHLSYNAYGDMRRTEAPLPAGVGLITARFESLADFAWRVTLHADDKRLVVLESVPMLVGMSPFTGISVGFDGAGPVDWDLHERHGVFRYSGGLRHVRYEPGAKAPYNREIIIAIDELSAQLID